MFCGMGILTLRTMAKQGETTVGLVLGSPAGICLSQNSSVKKLKPGHFNLSEQKACVFPTAGPKLRCFEGACVCGRELLEHLGWVRRVFPTLSSGFVTRSDVVTVIEIRWVQAVIMPLAPLLNSLPASLFLFWGGEMRSC